MVTKIFNKPSFSQQEIEVMAACFLLERDGQISDFTLSKINSTRSSAEWMHLMGQRVRGTLEVLS